MTAKQYEYICVYITLCVRVRVLECVRESVCSRRKTFPYTDGIGVHADNWSE